MKKSICGAFIAVSMVAAAACANAQDTRKTVSSAPNVPKAIGPYSLAIRVGKTVYLSGQIAIDPVSNQLSPGESIENQTRRTIENLAAVLAAEGLTLEHIVTTTVFLKDLNDFARMNEVYATYFRNSPPARATVEVARLPRDARIEISAIAVAP